MTLIFFFLQIVTATTTTIVIIIISFFFQDQAAHGPVFKPLTSIDERFLQRLNHLQKECVRLQMPYEAHDSRIQVSEHLNIDRNRKLVYCSVQKVGCTFWNRVFQILTNSKNISNPFQIKTVNAYEGYLTGNKLPFEQLYKILNSFQKFMFAREPFGRLLSFYIDKLYAPNSLFWKIVGTTVAKKYRNNATEKSIMCGHDATFEEVVRYFLDAQKTPTNQDSHFLPIFEQCRPCDINYNYIGKLETFEEDTTYLLNKFNLINVVNFEDFQKETEIDAINEAVDWVYAMWKKVSHCISKRDALFRTYRKLQIRGILNDKIPFPVSEDHDITREECKLLFLEVHGKSGSSAERKGNRQRAFIEAYKRIPPDLFGELRDVLSIDAALFGYETYPSILKNVSDPYVPNFVYFEFPQD